MSSYERRILGQISRFLLQESFVHAKRFSQMQLTLTNLENMMSTATSAQTVILGNVTQIVADLGTATTDLKQLLTDQAAAIANLQATVAAGTASPQFTADQLATLQTSTSGALAGVDALDQAIKTADAALTAPAAPAPAAQPAAEAPAPTTTDPAAPAAAATSTLTPGGVLVHGVTDPSAPTT